ncbi:hypothetical protein FB451DRAFT_441315 [Mycena latifolia]|nr:hypothetical protein FB451DRAFT_441315 [Mycena latifolia]
MPRSPRKRKIVIIESSESESDSPTKARPPTQASKSNPAKRARTRPPSRSDSPSESPRNVVHQSASSPKERNSPRDSDSESDTNSGSALNSHSSSSSTGSRSDSDLYISPPPETTKVSPKAARTSALEALKKKRSESRSPRKVVVTAVSDASDDNSTSESDDEGSSDASEEQPDGEDELSKRDKEDSDMVLKHHFKVVSQYLTHLAVDKKLKRISTENKSYFLNSVAAIDRHTSSVAANVLPSTCKAPFKATLVERPEIRFEEVEAESNVDCAACWQRGRYRCSAGPKYIVHSKKGTYDRETLRRKDEEYSRSEYATKTRNENNAVAALAPYHRRRGSLSGTAAQSALCSSTQRRTSDFTSLMKFAVFTTNIANRQETQRQHLSISGRRASSTHVGRNSKKSRKTFNCSPVLPEGW